MCRTPPMGIGHCLKILTTVFVGPCLYVTCNRRNCDDAVACPCNVCAFVHVGACVCLRPPDLLPVVAISSKLSLSGCADQSSDLIWRICV